MDVSSIASLATDMAASRTQQAAQIAVLKMAIDMQGEGVLQLLQAVAEISNNPPHLGNSVDTFA